MKLLPLISFLLILPLCSIKFGESHGDGVLHTVQDSVNLVEERIPKMMDYPEKNSNPSHDKKTNGWGRPVRPPPPQMNYMDHQKINGWGRPVRPPPPQMIYKNHQTINSWSIPPPPNHETTNSWSIPPPPNHQRINGWGRPVRPPPPIHQRINGWGHPVRPPPPQMNYKNYDNEAKI
ncbi:PREDICTED: splicing factor 3B subunit 4-like [Camelina sativa]|uniref:Splicing factor 3B subunit 4-like n=1 Tax=Camelina sativa TaxID=90675 RepID=A0ABM0ZG58_CAMSA|nr:PREDICTED: splicing factor 3B subunit 4-like [Camelina sativa]